MDIRSDLYSFGVVLWEMVTGRVVFRGSPAEVMYQHQHTPLPFNKLEGVPRPVVALLEMLLQKDPARRFQSPAELLELMPRVIEKYGQLSSKSSALGKQNWPHQGREDGVLRYFRLKV